ncbi:hypothetical protein HDV05_003547, partial [Chytridiales sp. JEL 0842]
MHRIFSVIEIMMIIVQLLPTGQDYRHFTNTCRLFRNHLRTPEHSYRVLRNQFEASRGIKAILFLATYMNGSNLFKFIGDIDIPHRRALSLMAIKDLIRLDQQANIELQILLQKGFEDE